MKCERGRAAVPFPSDGLDAATLDALATGGTQSKETTMDEKMMGVVRHVLTAVGAVAVYAGYTDDASWVMVSGALATMVGFVWSWMNKV